MSVSYWMDRKQNNSEDREFDVLIIGGGIAGLSVAYWLRREQSDLNIAIIEKYQLGDGATGRNAGFITCGSVEHFNRLVGKHGAEEAEKIWKFSEENLKLLRKEIIKDNIDQIGFSDRGTFSIASTENEFTELKKSAELMQKSNIRVEILGENDLAKRLGVAKFVGGIKYLDDASVHPLKLLNLIKKSTEDLPGSGRFRIFENSEVFALETDPSSKSKMVRTKNGIFKGISVVLATNGYSPLLHQYFEDKIFPTRGQVLATAPMPQFMEGPCYANFVLDYFRQLPTGELILGGFRQLQKDTELGYADQTSQVIQSALNQFIVDHIPPARNVSITHRWSGIMGFSVDGQPLIGSLPDDPAVFFVGGFTAHGLGLAFHCAKVLVDSMFERAIPSFLSAKRFLK